MHFKPLKYADIEKIGHLQPDGWPDIKEAFQFYCFNDYCYSIKITIDNVIVGIGTAIFFESSAWLAHIIVHSDYRKRGIGAGLVDSLLSEIKRRRIDTMLLIATELGEPIYQRAGFRVVSEYRYFKRNMPFAALQQLNYIQPYSEKFSHEIIRLDAYISGEHRERLLKNYLPESFVFIKDDVIKGFYLPGLGEGPVYATTIEAGRELMLFKIKTSDKATIPGENEAAIEFIKQNGFIETSTTGKRMILGPDIAWKPGMIYSRIGGNLG